MKGYKFPYRPLVQQTSSETVICNRCRNTWREDVTHYGMFAGYARSYDYCDKCITPEEEHGQPNNLAFSEKEKERLIDIIRAEVPGTGKTMDEIRREGTYEDDRTCGCKGIPQQVCDTCQGTTGNEKDKE